jgi:hypothetical protein
MIYRIRVHGPTWYDGPGRAEVLRGLEAAGRKFLGVDEALVHLGDVEVLATDLD